MVPLWKSIIPCLDSLSSPVSWEEKGSSPQHKNFFKNPQKLQNFKKNQNLKIPCLDSLSSAVSWGEESVAQNPLKLLKIQKKSYKILQNSLKIHRNPCSSLHTLLQNLPELKQILLSPKLFKTSKCMGIDSPAQYSPI